MFIIPPSSEISRSSLIHLYVPRSDISRTFLRMFNRFACPTNLVYSNIVYLPSPPPPHKKGVKKEKDELTNEDILLKGGTGPKIKGLQFDTTATLVGWSQAD